MENTTLADRIRSRLDALGKNPSAVALEAGLSRSAVLDILRGKAANPRLDTLQKLTEPLECSLEYLTGASAELGASPANQSLYALLDTQVTSVTMNLETGVFREGVAFADDHDQHVLYRDARAPERSVSLYRIADHSLAALGILKGDLAHVLEYIEEPAFKNGMLVAVRRHLKSGNLNEFSARVVEVDKQGSVAFVSRPVAGQPAVPILVSMDDPMNDRTYFANTYYATNGDHIEVLGVICRIVRDLAI